MIVSLFQEMAHIGSALPLQKFNRFISEANFYASMAHLLSGDADQCAHMVRYLASTHPNKQLTSLQLYQVSLISCRHVVVVLVRLLYVC